MGLSRGTSIPYTYARARAMVKGGSLASGKKCPGL